MLLTTAPQITPASVNLARQLSKLLCAASQLEADYEATDLDGEGALERIDAFCDQLDEVIMKIRQAEAMLGEEAGADVSREGVEMVEVHLATAFNWIVKERRNLGLPTLH